MFDKMKQLMEMKKQADQIKRELDAEIVECHDVRGIEIKINGSQDFQSILIDDSWMEPAKKERFESELKRSLNMAIKKSQNVAAQKMKSIMPGGFPGM